MDAARGVPGVHHEAGLGNDAGVVVIGVNGDDQDAVIVLHRVERNAVELEVVLAALGQDGEVRIVVGDFGALLLQELDDGEGGGFAQVVNILFIGDAQNQDASAV